MPKLPAASPPDHCHTSEHNRRVESAISNLQLPDTPIFSLGGWKLPTRFAVSDGCINDGFGDSVHLTHLALKSKDGPPKKMSAAYSAKTRDWKEGAPLGAFLKTRDNEFAKTAHERSLWVNLRGDIEKKPGEALWDFRVRYGGIPISLQRAGIAMPAEIYFTKSLTSMQLGIHQFSTLFCRYP